MSKSISKTLLVLSVCMLAVSFVAVVAADGGGHLWFYSQDPDTISGPQPLPNPEDYDPNYYGSSSDPWLAYGVLGMVADWETPFSVWLGCAQFESRNTMVVISINDAAYAAISSISVYGMPISSWTTSGMPSALAPHGVFNSAEFYGYAEVNVGDLEAPPGSPYKVEIPIDITLVPGADLSEAKVHLDAYGMTDSGAVIFSPYSHDFTFMVPEAAPLILMGISFGALGVYAYKRKNANVKLP